MIVRNGKLALTQKGEQGHYILKPKLSDFRNRIYSSANENLTMQIASQVFGIETAANGLCFSKEENRLISPNGSMSNPTAQSAEKKISHRSPD